jgi:lactate dehydrogenase-like 2-hydroxyacid dehydrogenase
VLGPFDARFGDAVAALPRRDAERIAVIVAYGTTKVTPDVIDALPALALVCCVGSGYEGVDLVAARARGIAVANSVGSNASPVADLAVGLLIASVRGIAAGDAFVRRGDWARGQRPGDVRGLTGRKVGVFGLGAIGIKIAQRCEAFEIEVAYHGRAPHAGVRWSVPCDAPRPRALGRRPDDRRARGTRQPPRGRCPRAGRARSDGHVVNITRGSVIDEAALVRALADGTIAGAGLDVFEHEPAVPDELRALPNVVMTPHLGGAADEAQDAMREATWRNLEAFATRGAPVQPVLAR